MDITSIRPDVSPTLVNLQPGAHLCSLYETEEEHRALLTPFLRQGLERGEKVLYIVDARTADAILSYLRNDGLDVEPFLARGQLGILTVRDAYMREGTFDPDRMIALLRAATDQAVAEGYPVLRVTGEMTWALRGLPGSERLIEYEAKLNHFFPGSRCLALCQYDRRRFTPEVQLDILATHPMVAVGTELHDNPYYLPPAAFLARDRPEARLEQWLNHLAARKQMDATLRRVIHDRGERVKELTCLYRSARLLQDRTKPAADLLRELVALLPPAWQYPESTAARITLDGQVSATPNFAETPWKQRAVCETADGRRGTIEVAYLEEKPDEAEGPFLAEERNLIDAVADSLVSYRERKQTEEALRASEETFRAISASAQDAVILLDHEGQISFWNQAAERIFGYRAEEIRGRNLHHTFAPGRFREAFLRGWDEFRLTGQGPVIGKTLELAALRRDGVEFPIELSVSAVKLGGRWNAIGILRDITERKQAEEAIRESEVTLRAITDSAQDAVVMVDDDGLISYWNPAAERMFGYPSQVALGKQLHAWLVPSRYRQAYLDGIARFRETGQGPMIGRMTEAAAIRADGTEFPVEVSVAAVRLKNKWHAVGILRDITERKRAEEQLHRINRNLRMLSLCNQALIRASEEATFLETICRILVETGEYRAVCVCLDRTDAEPPSPASTRFGFPPEYLESSRLTWSDRRRAEPIATAMRTGRPVAARTILTDPAFAPWRDEANRFGYASFIALPLLSGEDRIGLLQIHAQAPDAFDAEEVALLAELADDAAYGVRQLRLRAERRRLSEQLISQGRTLDAFFLHSVTPLVILDKAFNFIRVNEAYAKACQRDVSEFAGHNHFEFYPSDAQAIFEEVVRTGRPYQTVARPFVYPDHPEWGVTYWDWTLTPILDRNGEVEFLVFSLKDVTDRERAEEEVRLSEARLNAAQQVAHIGSWELDLVANRLWWSDEIYRIFELDSKRFGASYEAFLDTVHPEDRAMVDRAYTESVRNKTPYEVVHRLLMPDGRVKFVLEQCETFYDPEGNPLRSIGIVQDVTERKEMERHAQRIEQLASMGQLLGGIVHELKNPLFVVTGRLQLLKEKLANREYDGLEPDLQKIGDAAQRMGGIAQRFLTLARPIQPALQRCSVAAILKGVLDFLSNELMKARITVTTKYVPDLPLCLSDPAQLHQAFLNLIMNALQAMAKAHGQGTLKVSARCVTDAEQERHGDTGTRGRGDTEWEKRHDDTETRGRGDIEIAASPRLPLSASGPVSASAAEGGWIEVRIQDDGPGIAPEHRAKLFEPFFTTKPPGEGTGLGLWTAQMIVTTLGGTVTCETEVGQGATFIVRLPVEKN